jgi:hypothetical protein
MYLNRQVSQHDAFDFESTLRTRGSQTSIAYVDSWLAGECTLP